MASARLINGTTKAEKRARDEQNAAYREANPVTFNRPTASTTTMTAGRQAALNRLMRKGSR